MACEVCGLDDDGKHFGVSSCRACAAFFRRSMARNAVYKCRKGDGECQMRNELRKSCSHCRLVRCKAVGMQSDRIQLNRDRNGPLRSSRRRDESSPEAVTSTVDLPQPQPMVQPIVKPHLGQDEFAEFVAKSIAATSALRQRALPVITTVTVELRNLPNPLEVGPPLPYPTSEWPVIDFVHSGFREYLRGERSVHNLMHPELAAAAHADLVFRDITHREFIDMDRACLTFMESMVLEWFPAYAELTHNSKCAVMRQFHSTFSPLHKCYLTSATFPQLNDPRFVFHFGQYTVMETGRFFNDEPDPASARQFCADLTKRGHALANKMRRLAIQEWEVAALAALILSNEVEQSVDGVGVDGLIVRERIFAELRHRLENDVGDSKTATIRMGQLMRILVDVELLAREVNESTIMRRLLSVHVQQVFED